MSGLALLSLEAQEIADDPSNDFVERDGKLIIDHEHINRSRLRVDTIKWRTAKLYPKKYSERQQISGADEGPIEVGSKAPPLLPNEVASLFAKTLDKMEKEMGLSVNKEDDALMAEAEDIKNAGPGAAPAAGGGAHGGEAEKQAQIAANRARLQAAAGKK